MHHITLHYITLYYITLHCITLHYIALHWNTLNYKLHYIRIFTCQTNTWPPASDRRWPCPDWLTSWDPGLQAGLKHGKLWQAGKVARRQGGKVSVFFRNVILIHNPVQSIALYSELYTLHTEERENDWNGKCNCKSEGSIITGENCRILKYFMKSSLSVCWRLFDRIVSSGN